MTMEREQAQDSGSAIRALVVDDNAPMARLIAECCHFLPGIAVVGMASSGETALEQAAALRPDLVLTDLDMPGIGGLQLIPRLRHRFPAIRIIATSVHDNDGGHWVRAAIGAGADSFLSKRSLADTLAAEIVRLFGTKDSERS